MTEKTRSAIGKASRNKGKRGERELASLMRHYGYDTRRGAQNRGGPDSPDVVGLPGIHAEVKRTEKLSLYDAVDQAKRDRGEGELPVVFHRRNDCYWVAIMPIEGFMAMYQEWEAGMALAKRGER